MLHSTLSGFINVSLDCMHVAVVLILSDCNLCRHSMLKSNRYNAHGST